MGEEDAIEAEEILRFALYKEVLKRRPKKKTPRAPRAGGGGGSGGDDDQSSGEDNDEDESGDEGESKRMEDVQNGKEKAPVDPVWGDGSQDVEMAVDPAPATQAPMAGIREDR